MSGLPVIFVHGWSVTSTDTYGQLPARLRNEARRHGGDELDIQHLHLGQYVSFRDEVRVEDIARAFHSALGTVLAGLRTPRRCVLVTHSTGGPVVREWLDRFYVRPGRAEECPVSHLIMLAPANFGSALAQLGKSRLTAMRAWFQGVEPGQGVLDWLELGSPESCALNLRWIHDYPALQLTRGPRPIFQFVLSGDRIDRRLYDHVNAYTGEPGSDGVVRLAAANLNARHVVLDQPAVAAGEAAGSARQRLRRLQLRESARAPRTAFAIVPDTSHSGPRMGIMRAVRDDAAPHPTVEAVLRCLRVGTATDYTTLCEEFDRENARHQQPDRRVEVEHVPVLPDRLHITDPHSMVIFRLFDDHGGRAAEVDLLLTAGPSHDPNQLPSGFLRDRQANRRSGHLCFQLNHAVLAGCPAIDCPDGRRRARDALPPRPPYGLALQPRIEGKLVEYWPARLLPPEPDLLELLAPNETTVIDIHLHRVVRGGVFRLTRSLTARDFRDDPAGPAI